MSEPTLSEYLRDLREASGRLQSDDARNVVPRRIDMQRWTPAEIAIQHAADMVEGMGAHPHLTDAVMLLAEARGAVAAFVDGDTERYPRAAHKEATEEQIDRAAWQMARISHPTFTNVEAWKLATTDFRTHWRQMARVALAALRS
jgi:hypothetical protein